jgi:hypothetical protein
MKHSFKILVALISSLTFAHAEEYTFPLKRGFVKVQVFSKEMSSTVKIIIKIGSKTTSKMIQERGESVRGIVSLIGKPGRLIVFQRARTVTAFEITQSGALIDLTGNWGDINSGVVFANEDKVCVARTEPGEINTRTFAEFTTASWRWNVRQWSFDVPKK